MIYQPYRRSACRLEAKARQEAANLGVRAWGQAGQLVAEAVVEMFVGCGRQVTDRV